MFGRPSPAPPDADAFSAEALTFLEPLFATAMRLTRNRADAEDLVQDTFVKAFRFSGQFKRGTNLRAWLYTILHNTWRNQRRDASRDAVEVDSEQVEHAATVATGSEAFETPERILMRSTLDADLLEPTFELLPRHRRRRDDRLGRPRHLPRRAGQLRG